MDVTIFTGLFCILTEFVKYDGEILIRIYLKHNRLEDALKVALNTLTVRA